MVVITNQTAVACTPEELFDDDVDIRNEVEWNPTAVSMEKLVFPLFVVMTRRQEKANMTPLREAVERRAGVVPGRAAREMPIIYRIFRRQFAEVRALVQEAPAADATRVGVVADHLGFLLDGLHMHHTTEDDLIWPKLLDRAGPDAPLVERMEEQHRSAAGRLV